MVLRVAIFGLFVACGLGLAQPLPSQYYSVLFFRSDLQSAWYYDITDVKQDGPNTAVRLIRIEPVNTWCPRGVVIRAAEATIAQRAPSDLASDFNPCSDVVPPAEPKSFWPTFGNADAAIMATCDGKEKKAVAPVGGLLTYVRTLAFGKADPLHGLTEADDTASQKLGLSLLSQLRAGMYDHGLTTALKRSASFDLTIGDYLGIVKARDIVRGELREREKLRFSRYVDPLYLDVGTAGIIQGIVTLRLKVNPSTGEVLSASVLSGQADLAERVTAAARQWAFEPGSLASESLPITYEYKRQCPVMNSWRVGSGR